MTPSVLARQMERGIRDFIAATFPLASPYFEDMVEEFLERPGNVFKGPYYQIGLPFRYGAQDGIPFGSIRKAGFRPWAHQEAAWLRLSGDAPRSTIVATGTGSGKTECFLYPILDYCARHRDPSGRAGIKAIILYPMNALADDQARRLADLIHSQPGLAGLRAGVYTGSASETRIKTMGPQELITDRDTLREYPPDILLTNYKMLDLLLLRARDRSLWKRAEPAFLVVDELHSFDGAQGTDLACLIRRVRERVGRVDPDSLACIGTSATLGSGTGSRAALLGFARSIFHASFDEDALVEESRESGRDFLADAWVSRMELPGPGTADALRPFGTELGFDREEEQAAGYLARQMRLWFPDVAWTGGEEDRIVLGAELQAHGVFQNILRYTEGRARSEGELCAHVRKTWPPARSWSEEHIGLCLDSLFALISHARRREGSGRTGPGSLVPFLTVKTHLWLRELRRLVASIAVPEQGERPVPRLQLADEVPPDDTRTWLPVVHCRECSSVGWLTREAPGDAPVIKDLRAIYNGFFDASKECIVLYPCENGTEAPGDATVWRLCPHCGYLSHEFEERCGHCHHGSLLPVWKSRLLDATGSFDSSCPRCGSAGDLSIMGAKAASLLAALVGQSFSSPFTSDKKLLAFSDSVQDAAHRAGFLTARAWTFSFRTALCEALMRRGEPGNLDDLADFFLIYWQRTTGSPERFVGTFLPPDLEWFEDYDALMKDTKLPSGSNIVERLSRRLAWEIASEFTYRSRIGRTLERTGTAIAGFDRERLAQAARELGGEAAERQERFRRVAIDDPGWARLLWGMLFRFKNLGAVDEASIRKLFEYGSTFRFQRSHQHMPVFARRAPHIVTRSLARSSARSLHEPVYAQDRRHSWFETWLAVCREALAGDFCLESPEEDTELLEAALRALVYGGLLVSLDLEGDRPGWLLRLGALRLSFDVAHLRCSVCGSSLESSRAELPVTAGMRCLRIGCRGVYREDTRQPSDYYRSFYRRGEVVRINGREHTGLLDGKERKKLEDEFLSGAHPWYPNLVSATPTLEMGINIGDLSTVFLCSIPPTVANFLQRIGRAGRVDGNASLVAMANAVPHDQYFFHSPQEMLEGVVDAPAIYDRAVAVLERHVSAFALARWMQDMPPGADPVPSTLGDLIAARSGLNAEVFPIAFLAALESRASSWLADFFSVFDHLPAGGDERRYLEAWLSTGAKEGHSLERELGASLDAVAAELDSMRTRRAGLRKRIAGIRGQGILTEELAQDCEDLEREAEGLGSGIEEIKKTETWQFLCDEGLLPNYAFPETGVKLKATFYRKNRENAKEAFSYSHIELVRSASSALQEFAPDNEFFGKGHRMKINRVDLRASKLETWRFCPACSHAVNETHGHFSLSDCPICRSPGWADIGQVHRLLRFRQVYSFSSYRESLISDSQEDREPVFYNTKLLVDFDPADPDNRYFGLEDRHAPIAIEFIRRATFREVNFGVHDAGLQGFPVAGSRDSKAGFPVCTSCGSLDVRNHSPECPGRARSGADGQDKADRTAKEVIHLYHEFSSEAIRLLVPANEVPLEMDMALESAVAAVYLGLKRHFGGKATHLRITRERSDAPAGGVLHYLVIYDSIPGGSGYLKDFFTEAKADGTTSFFGVLEKALEALETCSCRLDPEKDGCYRCVLSHRVSRKMKDLSRTMAMRMLRRILEERDALCRLGVQAAARVDPLYDSRLEEIFVSALQVPELWPVALSARPEIFHDKTGHYLQIGTRGYHLEQQALITVREPLAVTTRADFVFHPTASGEKPIVVYTDGFRYHGESIAKDLFTRLALGLSGQYRVFSFTWEDVSGAAHMRSSGLEQTGHPWLWPPLPKAIARKLSEIVLDRRPWPGCEEETGLRAFIAMLSLAEKEREKLWLDKARFSALSNLLSSPPSREPVSSLEARTGIRLDPRGRHIEKLPAPGSDHRLTLILEPGARDTQPEVSGWLIVDDSKVVERLAWSALLDFINLYQILPRFAFAAQSRALSPDWMAPAFAARDAGGSAGRASGAVSQDDADWEAVSDSVLVAWKPLVRHLRESRWPLPDVGYEEPDGSGAVVFTAELAWPEARIAILASPRAASDPSCDWNLIHWSPELPYPELPYSETDPGDAV